MKTTILRIICVILLLATFATVIWGFINKKTTIQETFSDGIQQIDLDTIYLTDSKVQVDFSEVIIGKHKETRKLIVSTQEATVYTELTDQLIQKVDFDFMKKTQKISYTGKGYFVVDLDDLTKDHIIDDKKTKTLTIRIGHAYLETLEIDPEKVIIDDVKESLLAKGDIELTVKDYNSIEKELADRLEKKFNTAENGQNADTAALRMVKDIYEPVIKAIDPSYTVSIEFR